MDAIDEKLLARRAGSFSNARMAPEADVAVHEAGVSSDLETRIDAAPLARPAQDLELKALRQMLATAGLQGMMTLSRTGGAEDGLWVQFQSAVVLSAANNWDIAELQSAVRQTIAAHLTAGGLGLEWKPVKVGGTSYFELSQTRPLEMAVQGKLCLLTDDRRLMEEMLGRVSGKSRDTSHGQQSLRTPGGDAHPAPATLIAGFNIQEERGSFGRWSALVDKTNSVRADGALGREDGSGNAENGSEPSFFSQNMRGLGDVFAALESERVVEQRDGALTRQTVTYAWRK